MKNRFFLLLALLIGLFSCSEKLPDEEIVDKYVSYFNSVDSEFYFQFYPNAKAAEFLKNNIPFFQCPDAELEKTYYFRWWTFRKHVKETPEGYVITEFLPPVGWAKKYNTINCALQHQINEGRWLKNDTILKDYMNFWIFGPGSKHDYSIALSDILWQYCLVKGDNGLMKAAYPILCEDYEFWKNNYKDSTDLYWRIDGWDGMEISVGGSFSKDNSGYRPTINSYQYANAKALSEIAKRLSLTEESVKWAEEAAIRKKMIDSMLWDEADQFYKVIPRGSSERVKCREQIGYIPWIYDIPDEDKGKSWLPLFDTMGFKAPYGPTTAEIRDPGFKVAYEGHECQWNGPSWPYATSQTLTAMASCYQRFGEKFFTKEQYMELLQTYSNSHRKGDVCWIDENLNPFNGDWISRTLMLQRPGSIKERGKDYNHSSFCDLIISGLMGVRPHMDGTITINPMLPENQWKWFALTNLTCHGRTIDIIYDKTGWHYGGESGFNVYADGKQVFHSDKIESCTF